LLSPEAFDWVIHDYVPPRGWGIQSSGVLEAQSGRPQHAPAEDSGSLEPQPLSPFRGTGGASGIRLKDLLVGDEVFVHDVSTSLWAALWDCILARAEEFEGRHEFTAVVVNGER